jgi:pyruvate/2-oxoglutarate dehydrogenase complex dihydrolipoamide dehydrogenase (E3) component
LIVDLSGQNLRMSYQTVNPATGETLPKFDRSTLPHDPEEDRFRMTDQAVDVVVIGLGPGGEEVAGQLAQAGLSVVGIDSGLVGGECPYWGCIPSKMMIRAANLIVEALRVDGIAGSVQVTPDWGLVAARIREDATDNWNDDAAVKRFTDKGGRFVRGRGRMTSANTVVVGDQSFHASRAIVLATGSSPAEPPILGIKGTKYWTNHEAIEVETLPASLIVLGGGAIGVELAQVFARFGVNVTVVEAADRLLSRRARGRGVVEQGVQRGRYRGHHGDERQRDLA